MAAAAGERGWQVLTEPHLRDREGILKWPEIILINNQTLGISDIGVYWEGPENLNHKYQHKVVMFGTEASLTAVIQRFSGKTISIAPLILRA